MRSRDTGGGEGGTRGYEGPDARKLGIALRECSGGDIDRDLERSSELISMSPLSVPAVEEEPRDIVLTREGGGDVGGKGGRLGMPSASTEPDSEPSPEECMGEPRDLPPPLLLGGAVACIW